MIQKIVGEKVRVIDPAPAVARQVKRLLEAGGMLNRQGGAVRFVTSGEVMAVESVIQILLGGNVKVELVTCLYDREVLVQLPAG